MMVKKCNSSVDCLEDYTCSEGLCYSCLSCGLLFREGPSCVINFQQCGGCLKGYKDFPITDFSTVLKPCELIENRGRSHECSRNEHCPFDYYCHENLCIKCFDCRLYNRLPPGKNCAKEPKDCSSCFNGFFEVPVTTETVTKPCQKVTSDSVDRADMKTMFGSSVVISLCLLTLFAFLVVVVILNKKRLGSSKSIDVSHLTPRSHPPPYSVNSYQYVPEPEIEVEEESSFCTFVQEDKQLLNTAKVFRLPQAPYYTLSAEEFDELYGNSSESENEDTGADNSGTQPEDRASRHSTEANSLSTPSTPELDDFEIISESELENATESNGNWIEAPAIIDSAGDTIAEDDDSRIEECKNGEDVNK